VPNFLVALKEGKVVRSNTDPLIPNRKKTKNTKIEKNIVGFHKATKPLV
jgi:hypothetical protein